MPPKIRYGRDEVVAAALQITRTKGLDALNARAVAAQLGCSTQPLFREFSSMEQIRQEVYLAAMQVYDGYMARSSELAATPYLGCGMAYLLFAREEPKLFELLYMRSQTPNASVKQLQDQRFETIVQVVMQKFGYDHDKAQRFHEHIWIYTHGLAAMLASGYLNFSDDELQQLLREVFQSMRLLADRTD